MLGKKFKNFWSLDLVMFRFLRDDFLEKLSKVVCRSARLFKILTKLNENAYVINLPEDFGTNLTFNIEDLIEYKCLNFNPCNTLVDEPFLSHFLSDPHFPVSQISVLIQQRRLIKL